MIHGNMNVKLVTRSCDGLRMGFEFNPRQETSLLFIPALRFTQFPTACVRYVLSVGAKAVDV